MPKPCCSSRQIIITILVGGSLSSIRKIPWFPSVLVEPKALWLFFLGNNFWLIKLGSGFGSLKKGWLLKAMQFRRWNAWRSCPSQAPLMKNIWSSWNRSTLGGSWLGFSFGFQFAPRVDGSFNFFNHIFFTRWYVFQGILGFCRDLWLLEIQTCTWAKFSHLCSKVPFGRYFLSTYAFVEVWFVAKYRMVLSCFANSIRFLSVCRSSSVKKKDGQLL